MNKILFYLKYIFIFDNYMYCFMLTFYYKLIGTGLKSSISL